ncbi:hypothetical protein [Micromonospora pisi]|uniref:hypothetical protein n=1 Tax=Micromonospora pisi TaxID=589240 RepID=UPI000EAF04B4|nr:hypothetical protein [Micromonospora pisi]
MLDGYAQAAQQVGQEHPDSYAGLEVHLDEVAVWVHRKPSPTLDDALRHVVPPGHLCLRDARYSAVELETWLHQVRADVDYWAGRQIVLNTMSIRPGRDCVEIGVDRPDVDGPTLTAYYQATIPVCVELGGALIPLVAPSPAT